MKNPISEPFKVSVSVSVAFQHFDFVVAALGIYAKENVKRMYAPYHELGGNDVATELVEKILELPTEKRSD